MTFEVYIDDKLLFYPNDEECAITNGTVENALNEAGSFECDIPKNNPLYDAVNVRQSMVRVLQNGVEIFYGEVREVTQNFNMTKHIYAVGELAFLFDSIQPQKRYQTSPLEMFKAVIAQHNSQVEDRKKFEVGYVSVTDNNDYIYRFTNREDTLTVLRDDLATSLNGFLRIRKDGNTRYLDLVPLENYGTYCKQEIQFGENLLDYSANTSANDIATAVIPLGARLENEQRTADAVDGLDEQLTIKSVNSGKDYVFIQSAVNRFGWVKVVKEWSDVTDPATLKKKAEDWLKSAQYATMELQVNAFDNNLLDINVDSFDVGDTVHAWALPYGMDTTFPVRKKVTYINDVSKNYITLGSTATQSFTSQASAAVNLLHEELPEVSPILKSAKDNALAMLNGSVGGHVIFKFDKKNEYVEEMLICNASTEELSTQKWVWNLNGLGYMTRKSINDKWSDLGVAITMNGAIVADYITTGVMLANRIRGGLLALGGSEQGEFANGKLEIYGSDDKKIGSWDINGIDIDKGDINLGGGVFHVDNSGNMSCSSATITSGLIKTNANAYINFGDKTKDYPYTLHFYAQGGATVNIDSSGRFVLDRMVIANNGEEDKDSSRIQFDKLNLTQYGVGSISWANLINGAKKGLNALTSQTQADWNESNSNAAGYIKNKPTFGGGQTGDPTTRDPNGSPYRLKFVNGLYQGIEYVNQW
ncbi:MAG: phage tail protein [Prevotellaceae bacterium]|nr:phage tail protein [Candidatus Colivivens equi]